jgi:hypothetical protein
MMARWTAETIPPELTAILDEQASKMHSPTGAVRSCLADILNAYDQYRDGAACALAEEAFAAEGDSYDRGAAGSPEADDDTATLLKRLERATAAEREIRARFRESNDELCALRLARPAVSGKRLEAAKRILEWIDDHAQGYGSPVIGVTHRGAQELPLRVDWLWTLLMEADEPMEGDDD